MMTDPDSLQVSAQVDTYRVMPPRAILMEVEDM